MKVEPILYGDRKVYTVPAFSRGIATWLGRLPPVWVEGEVTELRRNPAWRGCSSRSRIPRAARRSA